MYPLNDKDLDRLSRDAAEHYDVESSASGWERLESKLDKELPVKEKRRKRFIFWLFFIALLSGGTLVYLLTRMGTNEATNKDTNNTVAEIKENASSKDNTATPVIDQPANEGAAKNSVAKKDIIATDVEQNVSTKTNTKVQHKNVQLEGKTVVRSKTGTVKKQQSGNDQSVGDNTNNRLLTSRKDIVQKSVQPTGNAIADMLKTTMPVIDTENYALGDVSKTEVALSKKSPLLASTPSPKQPEKQPATRNSRWEFGVLAGPDFSNVEFKHNYKTGLSLGAYIGYRISDRWLVNTGFIYTKKFYKVAGEDFTAPKHSWLSYQDVQLVTGSCNMFEIPLNVRFDFSFNEKRRWFASTGVSSYIMDKQAYICDYTDDMGQAYKYDWSENKNYDYFISNLNLSIGYERTLGKHFSIQAEPYFKIPIQGLGYGSIKMNSYGAFFTLKYKPVASKK